MRIHLIIVRISIYKNLRHILTYLYSDLCTNYFTGMKANIIKLKILDLDSKQSSIVELDASDSIIDVLKAAIRKPYSDSILIFVGNKESNLDITTLYRICQAVRRIAGGAVEWNVIDATLDTTEKDLSAYLILKNEEK